MKLLNSLLLAAGLSLAGSAIADCGSCCAPVCAPAPKPSCSPCSSPCSPCFNPCDWNPVCNNFSLGAGATYGTSGHLHGWGGFIEGNYNFCGNHFLGLQLTILEEKGNSGGEQFVQNLILGGGAPFAANVKQNRKAKLEQFLLMVNYTYHGSFADFSCWDSCCLSRLNYYLGGGLGLNFARTDDQISQGYYDNLDQLIPGTSFDSKQKKNHTAFAAQLFGGLGYSVTECIEIFSGVRLLFTEKFKFHNYPAVAPVALTNMHTNTTQLLVDMGVNWRF